jgi:hypothetical protein
MFKAGLSAVKYKFDYMSNKSKNEQREWCEDGSIQAAMLGSLDLEANISTKEEGGQVCTRTHLEAFSREFVEH